MTETRLRTLANTAAYSLASLFFAALALQNLRFGFYGQFYLACLLTAASIAGLGYSLTVRGYQLKARWHSLILVSSHLLVLISVFWNNNAWTTSNTTIYWLLPLIVLGFLILPLRRALLISLPISLIHLAILLIQAPAADSVISGAAIIMVLAGAALASWHYDHMAQSAEDLAITDPVTGAHNARFLDETLQKEISRADASGHPLSVIMIGIDHHDQIRELLGHDRTQQVYRHLSDFLFGLIRAGDTLYFLGDGQFCLILPFTPEEGVRVSGERIRRSISEHQWPQVSKMTVSLGATTHLPEDSLVDPLRQRASQALTEAWRRGQDTLWFNRAVANPT